MKDNNVAVMERFREYTERYPRLYKRVPLMHPQTKKLLYSYSVDEYAYRRADKVPTMARGLFVDKFDNIIVRGYDKFFNLNEQKFTKWGHITENTEGPYILSLKENGCIIFVSVLGNDLLVTSKHSITKLNRNGQISYNPHAETGKKWLLKCIGDKKQELIDYIKMNNVTLIFELVDNDFEEHVLEYSKEDDGLYLHGINKNTVKFETAESDEVIAIAEKYNFKKVKYVVYDNITDLRKFVDECNGFYKGKAIEGWVARCKTLEGKTFFFKIKYDEPYLIYREWREATNCFLSKSYMRYRYPKTNSYIAWVKDKYKENPELFSQIENKKGIIKIRRMYLDEVGDGDYRDLNEQQLTDNVVVHSKATSEKFLIVPIGIIGFGKSTIGKVMHELYGVGHIQSDNINSRSPVKDFINLVCREFDNHDIVFADKNNHLRKHRNELCQAIKGIYPNNLWIIAIYWDINKLPEKEIMEFSTKRVEQRGENHQTLTPHKVGNYPNVIKMFLTDFQNLDQKTKEDSLIDEVLEFDLLSETKENVIKLTEALKLQKVSDEKLDRALDKAFNDKVTFSKPANPSEIIYYGLAFRSLNFEVFIDKLFSQYTKKRDLTGEIKKIFNEKIFMNHVKHITLCFLKNAKHEEKKYYKNLFFKNKNRKGEPTLRIRIGMSSVIWNENIITIPVEYLSPSDVVQLRNMNENTPRNAIQYHITIACCGKARPVQSKDLINKLNIWNNNNNKKANNNNNKNRMSAEKNRNQKSYTFINDRNGKDEDYLDLVAKPLEYVSTAHFKRLTFSPIEIEGTFEPFYF